MGGIGSGKRAVDRAPLTGAERQRRYYARHGERVRAGRRDERKRGKEGVPGEAPAKTAREQLKGALDAICDKYERFAREEEGNLKPVVDLAKLPAAPDDSSESEGELVREGAEWVTWEK